jgi:hypothetical protein
MGLVILFIMIVPLVAMLLLYFAFQRWTPRLGFWRWLLPTLMIPAGLLILRNQTSSTVDADEQAAFAMLVVSYFLVSAFLVAALEWRYRNKV